MNSAKAYECETTTGNPLEPLLDEHQYVAVTHESLATARRNRSRPVRKGCPFVKLGSRCFYRPQDVRAYIERNLRCVDQEGR